MELQTLGDLRLRTGPTELLAGRRKLLAVLTYLVRASPAPVSRDRLASLFWGERGEHRARQSLRQALSELRHALGPALRSAGEAVSVEAGAVVLDLAEFEREISAGRFADALGRWRGDFLAGVDGIGTEEYAGWLEGERAGARRLLARAAAEVVEASLDRGGFQEAAEAAGLWAATFPLDATAHGLLARSLSLAGRGAEAEAERARFAERYRDVFGHSPDPGLDVPVPPADQAGEDGLQARLDALLVGRESAFAELSASLRATRGSSGRGTTVLVGGARGAGRSRLCQAFLDAVETGADPVFVLRARAYPGDDAVPWSTLRALLESLGSAPGLGGAPEEALSTLAAVAPGVRDRYPRLPPPSTPDPESVLAALARVCADVGAEATVILHLDDAPRADAATRTVLAALGRRPPSNVLVLLAGRDEELEGDPHLASLADAEATRRVPLPFLTRAEARLIIRAVAEDPDAGWTDALAGMLCDAPGCVPGRVVDAIHGLVASGALVGSRTGGLEPGPGGLPRVLPPALGGRAGLAGASGPTPPERRRRRGLAGALMVALVVVVWAAMAGRRDLPTGAGDVATEAGTVMVLPFSVRGSDRYGYLGEGLVELLSLKLDHAGDLRGVDPPAVLAAVSRAREAGQLAVGASADISPAEALAVSSGLGAGSYVLGSVVEVGGRITLRASLYEGARLRATAEAGPAEEVALFELVDTLALQLLAGLHPGPADRMVRLAVATSPSLPALKAYLEGESAFRRGNYGAAVAAFERAVAEDTMFALAHYRYAVAAEWAGEARPAVMEGAIARARRHGSRLPDRDRRFLDAFAAYHDGRAAEAEAGYWAILESHPDDVDAWFALSEVLFHAAPRMGRPDALRAADQTFARVLELDPDHEEALLHVVRVAAAVGDSARVRSVMRRLEALGATATPVGLSARVLAAFVAGDSLDQADMLRELRSAPVIPVQVAAAFLGTYGRDPYGADRVAAILTGPGYAPAVRLEAHLLRALLARATGRPGAAHAQLDAAARIAPGPALEVRALWAADAGSGIDARDVEALRSRLVERAAGGGNGSGSGVHPELGREIAHYLAGRLALRLGDLDAARWHAGQISGEDGADSTAHGDTAAGRLAPALARGLTAYILEADGRVAEALGALEEIAFDTWHISAVRSPFYALADERFLRARLLHRSGRLQEALDWYSAIPFSTPHDLAHAATAAACAATVLDQLGRAGEAAGAWIEVGRLRARAEPGHSVPGCPRERSTPAAVLP
jgi:DNA-binding SARP family transcriptional activator